MKRLLLVVLVFTMCLSLCSCDSLLQKAKSYITGQEISTMPDDYVTTLENDEFIYELYKTYVKVTEYKAEATEVKIPSEIDGKPVKVIGSLCFFETAPVTSVEIPDSVETIEASAFYYAENLVSITIPDSVTSIGMRAFAWCNLLESVKLGSGITEIPDYCFNHCVSLTDVVIPDNVTSIGTRAFSYCQKLSEETIPKNVESVGDRAFVDCAELEYLVIENDTVALGLNLIENSDKAVIIASENSASYQYCAENGIRWSNSKSVEAVMLEKPETSVPSEFSEASESTESISE